MSSIKQFGGKARRAKRPDSEQPVLPPVTLGVLDRNLTFEFPGTGAMSFLTAAIGSAQATGDVFTASGDMLSFCMESLNSSDGAYLRGTLLSKQKDFHDEDLAELVLELINQWGNGTPTKPASDSSDGQAPTGKPSTATSRRAKSTRSTSRSTASSTRSTGS